LENGKAQESAETIEFCPHCGHRLSPWQQVLLKVDRALTCKNCWYRIILDVPTKNEPEPDKAKDKHKSKE
jgi:DNA-directed RNA polymerase subunit RPC12/RpoP